MVSYAEQYDYIGECIWCRQALYDARKASGWTGEGPDPATDDGDFGCDNSPQTTSECSSNHATKETLRHQFTVMEKLKNSRQELLNTLAAIEENFKIHPGGAYSSCFEGCCCAADLAREAIAKAKGS